MFQSGPLRPLRGVRVLDLSRYLPGPLLTRMLADLGADVLKVESLRGDALQFVPPQVDGVGAAYAALNQDKAVVRLDLKSDSGRAVLRELVAQADVLVETFRPGVLARMGLGDVEELAPRLIVCSVSGFGQTGSMASVAGHDLNYLAHAGVLSLFGPADRPPLVPGVQLSDVGGGTLPGVIAVLAALLERQQTGTGRHLDVSMTREVVSFATVALAAAAAGGTEARGQGMLTGGAPCYRCYATKDGRYMAVGALEPHFFAALCGVLRRPDLAPRGYDPTAAAELETVFATRTQLEWVAALEGVDAACTPVRSLDEVLADPELPVPVPERAPQPADSATLIAWGASETSLAAARDAGALP